MRWRPFASMMAACMVLTTAPAHAAERNAYPSRPVRMVVPFPPGGPTDILARVLGQHLSESLGQPFVVENKSGANTLIGAELVARSAPDGYTLLMAVDNTLVMNQFLHSRLSYDPVKDFSPIAKVADSPLILVSGKDGPKTLDELAALARAQPGKISYGYGTITSQLAGEMLKSELGLDMVGDSYRGSNGTIQGMLSQDVTFVIDGVATALPHIKGGKLHALANLSQTRIPDLPALSPAADHPRLHEMNVAVWMALVAPAGTPDAVIQKIEAGVSAALKKPDVQEKLLGAGLVPKAGTSAELKQLIRAESARWKPVIERAAIKIQ
ncbi:hypothetical protein D9M73_73560 [compost metagenome]|uniref:Bug family tripartite tricarboxylate transporter substrate binding protein n=1 Tax=Polaromonas sp. TaxID=1869339 RepID=UPI003346F4C9